MCYGRDNKKMGKGETAISSSMRATNKRISLYLILEEGEVNKHASMLMDLLNLKNFEDYRFEERLLRCNTECKTEHDDDALKVLEYYDEYVSWNRCMIFLVVYIDVISNCMLYSPIYICQLY